MTDLARELALLADADQRARHYLQSSQTRHVFPHAADIAALSAFEQALPERGTDSADILHQLDSLGSVATVVSNGPSYFGFVIGATLPAAAAAERMVLAWDQCASSFANSPIADTLERIAGRWVCEALMLPSESAVGFGTSATASTLASLSAARRSLLARKGWDFDADGLIGAPEVKVVISASCHITVKKALRILGFGSNRLIIAATDKHGRIDTEQLPPLDDMSIVCLQAGEVNTGEFDNFSRIIPQAKAVGAWVHVDGAFGLWTRASSSAHLAAGVELADSWTTDGHKWLNTPYDSAMAICRDSAALASAMNSDAVYASASADAQKNLTLEFSRRARGIAVWAALASLGRDGLGKMIDTHIRQAAELASKLRNAGFNVLNRCLLNQVLVRADTDQQTIEIREAAQQSGLVWFGATVWEGRPAFRLSVSSWRTQDTDIDALASLLIELKRNTAALD